MGRAISIVMGSFVVAGAAVAPSIHAQSSFPLEQVAKYEMPASITGRFDHLGVDLGGKRLLVAAESAHQVLVFDLETGKYLRSIEGIQIPHAIFVRDDVSRIYVTDGGLGAVRVYDSKSYALIKTIPLKVDADSIGYDPATHFLYVDNGGGDAHEPFSMLSVIDTTENNKVADIKIDGETLEAMALERSSDKMYVNNAAKNQVAVVNRKSRTLVASWPVTMGQRNVAMALDEAGRRLFLASRSGTISVIDTQSGKELTSLPIGKGVDDLAFDAASKRLYAPCGTDGLIYVYAERGGDQFAPIGKVPSAPGVKNGLLAASLRRYFVIVPPQGTTPGAVYAYALQ